MPITRLSGGSTPADGSDPRTFPAIWNPTADLIEANETDVAALQALVGDNNLNDINDVEITAPADGQFLVYDNGDWVNSVPAGMILQVVSTTKNSIFTTSSGTLVDVTDFNVTITPTSTSSKVLVLLGMMISNDSSAQASQISLRRDSTGIAEATTDQTARVFTASTLSGGHFSLSHLDSPATTSAVVYKVQVTASGGTVGVGKYAASTTPSVSTITVMEVAG